MESCCICVSESAISISCLPQYFHFGCTALFSICLCLYILYVTRPDKLDVLAQVLYMADIILQLLSLKMFYTTRMQNDLQLQLL